MKRILLLDDDMDLCLVLEHTFEVLGVPVHRCINSVDELKELKEQLPEFDIALLDVNLGQKQLTGLDAYSWLMEMGFEGKIVFFTGHARTHPLVKRALDIPNVDMIEKPADISVLEALVQ